MTPELPTAAVEIEVPFHDIDIMEVVWHGHYSKYFEIARCRLLDQVDYNYPQMRESGFAWPVIDLQVRYIQSATFGQRLTVTASLVEWEHRLKINYAITDTLTGKRIAKGHTCQVAVNMENKEMCFVSPPILLDKLLTASESGQ